MAYLVGLALATVASVMANVALFCKREGFSAGGLFVYSAISLAAVGFMAAGLIRNEPFLFTEEQLQLMEQERKN